MGARFLTIRMDDCKEKRVRKIHVVIGESETSGGTQFYFIAVNTPGLSQWLRW